MKAIAVAVREGIFKLDEQGKSTCEIAASFGHCVAAVQRNNLLRVNQSRLASGISHSHSGGGLE